MRTVVYAAAILILFLCRPAYSRQTRADDDPAYRKHVTALPAVERVEVFAVAGLPREERARVDCANPDVICDTPKGGAVRILSSKTLSGEGANRISMLWRGLRRGNGAGCFAPGYVLRFYQGDKVLLATEVCFHCCNITLPGEGIASMCGSGEAVERFKEFLTTEVPYPKAGRR